VFDPSISSDPRLRARFQQQAAKAARLRHPRIAAVLDAGYVEDSEGGGTIFVVSEPAGEQSLRTYLERRPRLAPAPAIRLARQVAGALRYAHAQGVVHADVKPENVIVDRHGQEARLVDFSLSFVAARTGTVTRETLARRAAYLAPEQVRGEPVDQRTDVYGLGALLYEMVVGRPPFIADSPLATAERRVYEQARPAGLFEPSIPPSLDRIISKALERSPERRWASVDELDLALLGLGAAELAPPPDVVADEPPERVVVRPRRLRTPWGSIAVGVPLILAVLSLSLALTLLVPILRGWPQLESPFGGAAVPSLTGLELDAARQLAAGSGLQVEVVGERQTERTPRGEIVQQAPVAGRRLDPRQPIRVTLSSGVTVPDVRGLSLENATATLDRLGWRVGKVERGSYPGSPAGTVALQSPAPGESADAPGELLLAVAE
jgi:serine/threonine-protein kinase